MQHNEDFHSPGIPLTVCLTLYCVPPKGGRIRDSSLWPWQNQALQKGAVICSSDRQEGRSHRALSPHLRRHHWRLGSTPQEGGGRGNPSCFGLMSQGQRQDNFPLVKAVWSCFLWMDPSILPLTE
jgi:hypothetical protein